MRTKIKRTNISIYKPMLTLYKKYLLLHKYDAEASRYTWELIRKDMLANDVKESEIKKAEKGTPWED